MVTRRAIGAVKLPLSSPASHREPSVCRVSFFEGAASKADSVVLQPALSGRAEDFGYNDQLLILSSDPGKGVRNCEPRLPEAVIRQILKLT